MHVVYKYHTNMPVNRLLVWKIRLPGMAYTQKVGSMNHVSRQSHYIMRTLYCVCVVNNTRTAKSYVVLRMHSTQ